MIGIGFIISTWVGYGSAQWPSTSSFQWRFPLAFQVVPCIIIVFGLLMFPESPRFLIEKDKSDEALKVLHKLHYNGRNDDWIQQEFTEIKATIDAEKTITVPGWKIMFTVPQWRARLIQATLVQVFTQFTGINVIGYYQYAQSLQFLTS
jgi:MFS family permease